MSVELSLRFPDPAQVTVHLDEDGDTTDAAPQPFAGPLDAEAQQELHWYLEVYPAHYTTEVDDKTAARIAEKLPRWGEALFETVGEALIVRTILRGLADPAALQDLLPPAATGAADPTAAPP